MLRGAAGEIEGPSAEEPEEVAPPRNWLWIVTVILAMAFSLLRQCG